MNSYITFTSLIIFRHSKLSLFLIKQMSLDWQGVLLHTLPLLEIYISVSKF